MRALFRAVVLFSLAIWSGGQLLAWKCPSPRSTVCSAFAGSDIVFAGRVESMDPDWKSPEFNRRASELSQGKQLEDVEFTTDPRKLKALRNLYANLFRDPWRTEIRDSRTPEDLKAALDRATQQGYRVTFRITQRYKGQFSGDSVNVWASYSGCSVQFAVGETYLVYGSKGEQGRFETGSCSRSSRLSDAGEDLAYLFFQQQPSGRNGRIHGFVTTSERRPDTERLPPLVSNPAPHELVELRSATLARPVRTTTNREGAFVFDGLAPGEYELVVLDSSAPESGKAASEPERIRLEQSGCKSSLMYLRKPAPPGH